MDYTASIPILVILSWFYIFHFFSQPGGYVCISTENYKLINLQSIITPIIFIGSFFVFYIFGVGVLSFAYSKILMMVSNAILAIIIVNKWTNILQDIKSFLPLVLVLGVFSILAIWLFPFIFPNPEKSITSLILLCTILTVMGIIYCGCMVFMDSNLKKLLVGVKNKILYNE